MVYNISGISYPQRCLKSRKKLTVITALAIVSVMTLIGCGASKAATKSSGEKVRIGLLTSHSLPVIAQTKGYFEEEGIDAELVTFNTGAPEIEAFTAGELDIIHTGDLPFINAVLNGVDIQAIGTYSTSTKVDGIAVRDDANIHEFSDLKGKKISVPFGTNIQPLLYEYLEKGGLTGADVEILNLGGNDAVNALIHGDVDAAIVWEPFLTMAAANEGITYFADTSDIRTFVCPISSSKAYIKEHKETVQKVLRALNKASLWVTDHKEETADAVVKYHGNDNKEAVLIGLQATDVSLPFTQEKIDAFQLGADKCFQYGVVDQQVDIRDYIDEQFTDQLQ